MAKRVVPSWSVIVLRIYGALHIVAGGYCLLRTEVLFQGTLALVRLACVLMILTGIVALLRKRWGMLSATATALALLLTCLLLFFSMPQELNVPASGPMVCYEDFCYCMDTEIEFPHLRTNMPHAILELIVVLEWLAAVAYWRVWHVGKLERRRTEWVKLARKWATTGRRDSLRKANLRGADLSGVDLGASEEGGKGADLQAADLRASNLEGANLSGADLRGAKLEGCSLRHTKYDNATRWPEGFSPPPEAVYMDAEGNAH
jgi:hypothetical protein